MQSRLRVGCGLFWFAGCRIGLRGFWGSELRPGVSSVG